MYPLGMHADDIGGIAAAVGRPPSPDDRAAIRSRILTELPRLRGMLDAAQHAADGPDPEASLVFLGMLTSRASVVLFPL